MSPKRLTVGAITIIGTLVMTACGAAGTPQSQAASGSASAGETAAWEPEYVDGVLQPLPDGFPNQPITLLVADEAGSTDSIYASHMQSALADISPVAVETLDRDEGADPSWEAVLWTLDQEGGAEGYYPQVHTLPSLAIDPLVIDLESSVGIGIEDIQLLNVTEVSGQVLVSRADAPWGDSFEALVEHVKAGNEVSLIKRATTTGDFASRRIQELQGIEFRQIAGGSIDEDLAVVGAGEADLTVTQAPAAAPHYEAGRIVPLLVAGDARMDDPWEDVPSMADLDMPGEPWASNRGWLVSAEVPELHAQWLAELFRAGTENAEFQENRSAIPGVILMDPILDQEGAEELADRSAELAEPVVRDQGLHWDQQ